MALLCTFLICEGKDMSDFDVLMEKIERAAATRRTIHKASYDYDSIKSSEDIDFLIDESGKQINAAIKADDFLAKLSGDRLLSFTRLAHMCGRLAVCDGADITIEINTDKESATITVTSPIFMFGCRQLAYLRAAALDASKIIITQSPISEDYCRIEAEFDFTRDDDKLVNLIRNRLK